MTFLSSIGRDQWRVAGLTAAALLVSALLFAAPAIWNGYPLLYWDSYDYIGVPWGARLPVFRAASYCIITMFGTLFGTLWVAVALQCLLVAWIVHESMAVFLPWPPRWTLPVASLGIVVFTAEPWFTSQLMADGFTAPLVLGLAALAFDRGRLGRVRRVALVLVLAVAVTVHTSHIALVAGLVIAFAVLRLAAMAGILRWLAPRPLAAAGVLGLGVVLAAGSNWAVTGRVFVSQTTDILMLARMMQDGIAKRYLAEACARGEPLLLCPHQAALPDNANQFLWTPGPFYKIGGWSREVAAEARAILRGSLRDYPLDHLRSAWALTVEQLFQVHTGDGVIKLDTIHSDGNVAKDPFMPRIIARYYPGDLHDYWRSRQRRNFGFEWINTMQTPIALGGYASVLLVLAYGVARRRRLEAGLALTIVLAILGNAFVCGALSNPNNRYQARIAWTAAFVSVIALVRVRRGVADESDSFLPLPASVPLPPPAGRELPIPPGGHAVAG